MQKHNWHRVHLTLQSNTIPIPRWGHTCCVVRNQIILFGGFAQSIYMNDIWSFNTISMEWIQIKTTGAIPTPRSNCSMTYDKNNNRIIVFGGGGTNKRRYNTIHILNWQTKQWMEIQPKQNQPAPWQRTYHCAQLLYPYLIVFGGEGVTDMDDLWIFNFQTMSWKQIPIDKTKPRPCSRRFHSSAIIDNQFFIIGGCYGKYRCLSDVFSLDLTPLIEDGDIQRLQWKDRKPIGSGFLTRWGHSSAVYDNKIYIFGGRFCNDLNDLLVLNVQKNTMKALKIAGEVPKARRRHSACFIGSCMIIFGGFNGQYFNDLHYLNAFQLRTKLQVPTTELQNNIKKYINEQKLSDLSITTCDNEIFYVHKGLLVNGLKNEQNIDKFIKNINGKYNKQILYDIIGKIYQGYGKIEQNYKCLWEINLPETQEDYQQISKNQLIKLTDVDQKKLIGQKKGILPTIIQLQDDQFSSFLDQNREYIYKDSGIIINDAYLLKTNSMVLAINSQFFRNAFSGIYKDGTKQIKLALNSNNIVLFQVLINYLLIEKVILPLNMGLYSWMQFYEMSDYFCIERLKLICEQQLCNFVNEFNCDQIMTFSLAMEMENLALYCADYMIKCMVNKQDKFYYDQCNCQAKNGILEVMYSLSRFDILQVKLERMKVVQESIKRKISNTSLDVDNKQNYQTQTGNYS